MYGMKMTMHIDGHLLDTVMAQYGFETKTEAVHFALAELNRRKKLREFMKEDWGLTPSELKAGVYEDYNPESLRVAETPAAYTTDAGGH